MPTPPRQPSPVPCSVSRVICDNSNFQVHTIEISQPCTVPYPAWSLRIATCPWSYSLGTPLVPSPRHPFTLSRPPRPHDRCTLLCDSRVGRLHRSFFRSHPPGFAPLFAHVWSARSRLVPAFRLPALAPTMAPGQVLHRHRPSAGYRPLHLPLSLLRPPLGSLSPRSRQLAPLFRAQSPHGLTPPSLGLDWPLALAA